MTALFRSLVTLALLSLSTLAHSESITVENARINPTVTGMSVTGAYLKVHNHSDKDIVLLRASSPISARVELHDHQMTNGIMKMFELKQGLTVPAGGYAELKRGGKHIMLMELKQSVATGEEIPLTLFFSDNTELTISLSTSDMSKKEHDHGHNHGHDHKHHH